MKTLKKVSLELIEVEYIPDIKEMMFGAFYYARRWNVSNHLCPCGCGQQTPLPIKDGEWLIQDEKKLTLSPSIQHRYNCQSHYVIQNGFANILNEPIPERLWNVDNEIDSQPGE